jgi:hypothetical protein
MAIGRTDGERKPSTRMVFEAGKSDWLLPARLSIVAREQEGSHLRGRRYGCSPDLPVHDLETSTNLG